MKYEVVDYSAKLFSVVDIEGLLTSILLAGNSAPKRLGAFEAWSTQNGVSIVSVQRQLMKSATKQVAGGITYGAIGGSAPRAQDAPKTALHKKDDPKPAKILPAPPVGYGAPLLMPSCKVSQVCSGCGQPLELKQPYWFWRKTTGKENLHFECVDPAIRVKAREKSFDQGLIDRMEKVWGNTERKRVAALSSIEPTSSSHSSTREDTDQMEIDI